MKVSLLAVLALLVFTCAGYADETPEAKLRALDERVNEHNRVLITQLVVIKTTINKGVREKKSETEIVIAVVPLVKKHLELIDEYNKLVEKRNAVAKIAGKRLLTLMKKPNFFGVKETYTWPPTAPTDFAMRLKDIHNLNALRKAIKKANVDPYQPMRFSNLFIVPGEGSVLLYTLGDLHLRVRVDFSDFDHEGRVLVMKTTIVKALGDEVDRRVKDYASEAGIFTAKTGKRINPNIKVKK